VVRVIKFFAFLIIVLFVYGAAESSNNGGKKTREETVSETKFPRRRQTLRVKHETVIIARVHATKTKKRKRVYSEGGARAFPRVNVVVREWRNRIRGSFLIDRRFG